jgi:Cu-Zn family superoxide dismutase
MAVACFQSPTIQGEVVFTPKRGGVAVVATFTKLPPGEHGFHIHKAGDLRGEGCQGACEHFDLTGSPHGADPTSKAPRHTGDLGNIKGPQCRKTYFLKDLPAQELYGRSVIVHADPDDLGKGEHEDSQTTGHSGKRIGCAIIGRMSCHSIKSKTRKQLKTQK